ncbi:hypothetical protein LEMLEM_LOCUS15802, partial [Lemmus lemmus]
SERLGITGLSSEVGFGEVTGGTRRQSTTHSTSLSISESEKNLSGRHAKCRLLCSISKQR